jgi:hypothetical protein
LRRGAGQDGGDGALGRGAEEVERAACRHIAFPADQGLGQLTGIDYAIALDQEPAEQNGLLGVVGDRSGRHARRDRVPGRGGLEAVQQAAPPIAYLLTRKQLRGHAKGIAYRQAVKRASRPRRVTLLILMVFRGRV